jgi:hypothetical protein
MNAFFAGVVFGALLAGSAFTIFLTRIRRPKRREVEPWSEDDYQERTALPRVSTKVSIHERTISL